MARRCRTALVVGLTLVGFYPSTAGAQNPDRSVHRLVVGAAMVFVPLGTEYTGGNDEEGFFSAAEARWAAGVGAHASYRLAPALAIGLSPDFEWGGVGKTHSERVLRIPAGLEILFPAVGDVQLSLVPGIGYISSWHSGQIDIAGNPRLLHADGATISLGLFAAWPSSARTHVRIGAAARGDGENVTNGGSGYHNGPLRVQLVVLAGVDWAPLGSP